MVLISVVMSCIAERAFRGGYRLRRRPPNFEREWEEGICGRADPALKLLSDFFGRADCDLDFPGDGCGRLGCEWDVLKVRDSC